MRLKEACAAARRLGEGGEEEIGGVLEKGGEEIGGGLESGGAVGSLGEHRKGDEAWWRLGEREERRGKRRSC